MTEHICHEHDGVDGHRTMQVYLERKGKKISKPTIHKYMNRELGLKSVTRRKKPGYRTVKAHKVFRNIPEQDFECDEINTKWCTDFTYLFLSDQTYIFVSHTETTLVLVYFHIPYILQQ